MNALRMALDSIREKKGRSFLTMLGIIIGVTAVLVLVALVSGYNADITAYYEKLGVNKVNVTVNWYDASRSVDVMDALYDYGNGELGDMVLGVSPDLSTSLPMKYRTTTLDSAFDVDRRSRVCVLGSYVADSLFQYADPIGETVYFGGEPFTVVGIYYQKDGGEEGSMDDMAVIPYSLDRAILGTAQLTRFAVKVDQSDHMDAVMAKLERFLGETIDTSVGEYELENGNSAMSESTEEIMAEWMEMAGDAYATRVPAKPGVRAYLDQCRRKGERMIVLTSAVPAHCRSALTHLGLMEYFETIFFAHDLNLDKKDPDIFLLAAKKCGVHPADCTLYDDSVDACRGAKAAGMHAVGVYDPYFDVSEAEMRSICDGYIHSFTELLEK